MTTPLPSEAKKRKLLTLGPGTFTLGEIGTMLDMSCQLTEIAVNSEGDSEDDEAVLCGDMISGERTYTYTLTGNVFQDVELDGVIDFTWKHQGEVVPFKFVADSKSGAAVTGRVRIDPLTIGGTVKQKNKSEFEWQCSGTPVFRPDGEAPTTPTDPGTEG